MPEPKRVVVHRPEQLSPHEALQGGAYRGQLVLRQELDERIPAELRPINEPRSRTDRSPGPSRSTGCKQGVDRGRDGNLASAVGTLLGHHREHLLDEERIASAVLEIRARVSPESSMSPRSASISSSVSCSESGSRTTEATFARPPANRGRSSTSSDRPRQTKTIGASFDHSTMCSTRSRSAGSAQWASSRRTTSGRRRASASKSFRAAQNVSSFVVCCPESPTAPRIRSAIASASASRRAPPTGRRPARRSHGGART